eukprot:TRINITY_DN8107_c0_g1_i1.p1 TRINITY_DN8107_c0_g1~~TRINITY_DN8107_c0_g1_i1.p1  ORF type:complete len:181 (+),score=27.59 TRINITY_DN8107_c0_g1_i1:49-591(+)
MDSRTSSMLLIGLTLLGWVFVIVILAEPKSWWTVGGGGCGIFECSGGGNPASSGYCSLSSYAKAIQAFGVMAVLLISFMLVIHTIQVIGKGHVIPPSIQPHVRWVHIVAAVFLAIVWILEAVWVSKDCWSYSNGGRYKWSPSVAYGLFFAVIVMITEIVCWWLCASAGAPSLSGCQSLIN